jgi:hypothetical protein
MSVSGFPLVMGAFFADLFTTKSFAQSVIYAALFAAILRLWGWFMRKKPSRRQEIVFWALAPVSFLIFLLAVSWAVTPNVSKLRPTFAITVDAMNTGVLPPPVSQSYCAVFLSIKNIGDAPSIADHFYLDVHLGSTVVYGEVQTAPDGYKLTYPDGTYQSLFLEDRIAVRALQPIPTGGMARGYYICTLKNVPLSQLQAPGTQFDVGCFDVFGKQYSVSPSFTGEQRNTVYDLPGIRPQIPPPQQSQPVLPEHRRKRKR